MRYLFGLMCVLALGVMPMVGCSDTEGAGGSGGTAATGGGGSGGAAATGGGGSGGMGGGGTGGTSLCEGVMCEDTECKTDGACNASDGMCDYTLAVDGTTCSEGECLDGVCAPVGAFPCTEQGILDAIAEGDGPHVFACDGPTTVVTKATIVIDNDVILDGDGNLNLDGSAQHRVIQVVSGVTTSLSGVGVRNGLVTPLSVGGGIFADEDSVVTIDDAVVSGNQAGGIFSSGRLTITNSTISDNEGYGFGGPGWAVVAAGGVMGTDVAIMDSVVSGNTVGGILVFSPCEEWAQIGCVAVSPGALTMVNCTVTGSTIMAGVSLIDVYGGFDGGLATVDNSTISNNDRGIENSGALSMTNSTISGNGATDGSIGGIANSGTLSLTNTTVHGNTGSLASGIYTNGETRIIGSLVGGNCYLEAASAVNSLGYNIESPGDTCGFDQVTDKFDVAEGQLRLEPLADNGGPTMTHALLGGVAIDVIPPEMCEVDTDQRGVDRPQNTMCDVGAFELLARVPDPCTHACPY